MYHEATHKKDNVITSNIEGLFADYLFYNNLYNQQTKIH